MSTERDEHGAGEQDEAQQVTKPDAQEQESGQYGPSRYGVAVYTPAPAVIDRDAIGISEIADAPENEVL
jgi:hypothetical protein